MSNKVIFIELWFNYVEFSFDWNKISRLLKVFVNWFDEFFQTLIFFHWKRNSFLSRQHVSWISLVVFANIYPLFSFELLNLYFPFACDVPNWLSILINLVWFDHIWRGGLIDVISVWERINFGFLFQLVLPFLFSTNFYVFIPCRLCLVSAQKFHHFLPNLFQFVVERVSASFLFHHTLLLFKTKS